MPHPLGPAAPYSAIISPLIEAPPVPLTDRIGLTTSLEPSARHQLEAKLAELGPARYVDWVWRQRPRAQRASKGWKPFHHGEAKPPLTSHQSPAASYRPPVPDLPPRGPWKLVQK